MKQKHFSARFLFIGGTIALIAFGAIFLLIQTDAGAGNTLWQGHSNQTGPIWRAGNLGIGISGNPEAKLDVRGGRILFGGDHTRVNSRGFKALEVRTNANEGYAATFSNAGVTGYGVLIAAGYQHKSKNLPALQIGDFQAMNRFIFYNNGKSYGLSDERLKSDIRPLKNTLNKIDEIRGVTFKWNDSEQSAVGLIAQDVEKVFPELVTESDGYKGIDYIRFAAVLVEGVKELKAKNEMLLKRIEELEKSKL